MKIYNIILVVLVFFIGACQHKSVPLKTPIENIVITNVKGQSVLLGHCSISMLNNAPFNEWYNKFKDSYSPETSVVNSLQPLLKNKTIEIFLGSWCGDSKREVPKMLKILHLANVDTTAVQLIFVNNEIAAYKQSPQHQEAGKNIHHVPTFIVYDGKKEMGRIIESPIESLERDLLAIVSNATYIPNYQAVQYWINNVKHSNTLLSNKSLSLIATNVKTLCKNSSEFNAFGYMLLAQKKYNQAINIFTLNTILYPLDVNIMDSLAEAFLAIGNKTDAKKWYEKILTIQPGNATATKALQSL